MIGGDFGGSAGSAAADALHRGIGPVPAGQHVAVMTVRDALTACTDELAAYGVPCEIGHYSVQGEQREYVDSAVQKRYLRTPIPSTPNWDLNSGYENAQRRVRESMSPTHNLLRWIILNKDKVVTPSSDEERPSSSLEAERPRMGFICGRYTLATLLCTPFEESKAWKIAACQHRGIVYIRGIPMNEGVERSLTDSHDRNRDRLGYWGKKFLHIMTTNEPGASAEEDEVVRENDTYNVVLRCQLGSHSIVLGSEVKAVNPTVLCEPGCTAGYVEFKTCRDNFTRAQRYKFYRHALLRWWAHCRLSGVPKALCGYRSENGILLAIQEFDVMKMPEIAGDCLPFRLRAVFR
ncbi:decapping and exoribonuclease protein-like isoform X2 [Dermacentor silvarum]|uniref:decapping and exoribonuclease protein-like isoform X2 n=1 Tax=Dermacentor silvarum TaxID=543639 RepID=UPI002100934F|nr:decapping and exoribonuclease protein-like isoform X2 [Dermacentor silvarum]